MWAVPEYAHDPFSPKISNGFLFGWTLCMFGPNLKSVASPIPEIIANSDWGFWVGVVNPNLGEEEAVGVGDGTVRKSVGDLL